MSRPFWQQLLDHGFQVARVRREFLTDCTPLLGVSLSSPGVSHCRVGRILHVLVYDAHKTVVFDDGALCDVFFCKNPLLRSTVSNLQNVVKHD